MNARLSITATLCLASVLLHAQPFPVGSTNITFVDPTRGNRNIPCEVYYPAVAAGSGQAVANGSFPVLSFGHGFVMGVNAYYNLRDAFVPQGYILVLPTTEGGFSPSHGNFGLDLAFVIAGMQARGNDAGSPFFGKVASTAAIMGHSMGGGASFLGANAPQVTTVVNYAPAETNPSAIAAAGNVQKPVLVFAGNQDCVTPPASNQLPMYNAVPSGCKAYIGIVGGGHCNFANSNFNCGFGELTCGGGGSLGRPGQQSIAQQYTLLWLDRHLKGDQSAGEQFDALMAQAQGITPQQETAGCLTDVVRINLTVLLDGPYREDLQLMRDDLRIAGHLPLTEPYTDLGLVHVGGGVGQSLDAGQLSTSGADAVVDWVFVELRDAQQSSTVVATANGLLRRNGTVTAPNGGAFSLPAPAGTYFVAVRHRNHLGVMTAIAIPLNGTPATVDLSETGVPVFGSEARRIRAGRALLWAGNVNGDDRVQYTGSNNDRDPILQEVGGVVSTQTTAGYRIEDTNLDGEVRYTGLNNDRDVILQTIGGAVPTAQRIVQLP